MLREYSRLNQYQDEGFCTSDRKFEWAWHVSGSLGVIPDRLRQTPGPSHLFEIRMSRKHVIRSLAGSGHQFHDDRIQCQCKSLLE